MSVFALEEMLEADWVAMRPCVFQEREKYKFVFIVAWNEIKGKFAIACPNCTVQCQRSGSYELRRSRPAGPESRVAPEGSSPTVCRSPASGTDSSGLPRNSSRPLAERGMGAEVLPKSQLRAKSSPAQRPPRGPRAGGAAEEMEVLELRKEAAAVSLLPSLLQAAEPAAPDTESAEEGCSWAGLFSFQDLRAVYQQLCSVNLELEHYLSVFPEEPSGMWTVLFGTPERSEQEMDALCYKLQVYLVHSLNTCSWKILLQVLFAEADNPEEYYESLSELRQKGYEEVLLKHGIRN